MTTPWLVVLAVDLPEMQAGFLAKLVARVELGCGCVPRRFGEKGFYEPLAAVYPRECLGLARERLKAGDLAIQGFVRAAGTMFTAYEIQPEEEALFRNWNEP